MKRNRVLVLLSAVTVLSFTGCELIPLLFEPIPGPVPGGNDIHAAHNFERTSRGIPALTLDGRLNNAAQGHANWMAANRVLSHFGAGGSTPDVRMKAAGFPVFASAENIAEGAASVPEVMALWMNSPGHRANILNGVYTHVGYGVAADVNGRLYWAVNFAN